MLKCQLTLNDDDPHLKNWSSRRNSLIEPGKSTASLKTRVVEASSSLDRSGLRFGDRGRGSDLRVLIETIPSRPMNVPELDYQFDGNDPQTGANSIKHVLTCNFVFMLNL